MGGPIKGRADYLELGDFNASCSMCGRKRKASTLVRNWQGLYRCPEHNEPRQTQDYVRGTKDLISIPWGQPQITTFTVVNMGFPVSVTPTNLVLGLSLELLITETTDQALDTESGVDITTETGYLGEAQVLVPNWIIPTSFLWSWASGGAGITIDTPTLPGTYFESLTTGNSGVAQCVITNSLGGTATVTVPVSS